ncbi:hypothetical protein COU56_01130 [Candidatus Pacearchaeota archaeon CG10_big_fil_rev_8_21_14_0_10_31_9]|nr:MAG: hypothetical protein COU56_01130 [Candidatus Pacearchaeota archaeon CG10_big_fil_rev_8_21_14_0_10_31_9]PIZ82635.1 MAG: hypothetical protein COX97_03775 [Candidatus Pacearchaeota archaeon CG_4_10_14_0_2_um_filter_05_32_18]
MVSITLSVPEDIRKLMKKFPEINWSAVVRNSITEKAQKLALKEEMLKELKKEKEFNDWAVNLIRQGRHKNN